MDDDKARDMMRATGNFWNVPAATGGELYRRGLRSAKIAARKRADILSDERREPTPVPPQESKTDE